MNEPEKDAVNPPYISVARLERLLELLSTRSFSEITIDYLKAQGLAGTDANLGLATLRFLGISDARGKMLDSVKTFHLRGETRQSGLQSILKTAYKKLFDMSDEAYNLPKEDLINDFVSIYGVTHRVARAAVAAFLHLCGQAGWIVSKETQKRQRSTEKKVRGANKLRIPKKTANPDETNGLKSFPFLGGKIRLMFPENDKLTEVVLSDEFRAVSEAIKTFGDAFFTEDAEELKEGNEE